MAEAIVQATEQSDIEAAKIAAGIGGTVIFPAGNYAVDDLRADIDDQLWVMKRGAKLQRASSSAFTYIFKLDCSGLEIQGGSWDCNAPPTGGAACGGTGSSLKWTGGELFNSPGWGIQLYDADLILEDMYLHHTAYAAVLWGAKVAQREGPKIRRCRIDRVAGYVASGGILINSGGGVQSCFRPVVEDCDILLPGTAAYDNVGVEFNWAQLGAMINNSMSGSRIGFSSANCSVLTMIGNRSKAVSSYAHEIVNGGFVTVTGNSATGLSPPSVAGCQMSGTSRSNIITGNTFKQGFPKPVNDVSTPVAGYPSLIANNL